MQIRELTLEQINEYVEGWSESGKKKNSDELVNPDYDTLQLFNIGSGIERKIIKR